MTGWLQSLAAWWKRGRAGPDVIPVPLWRATLARHHFLHALPGAQQQALRLLVAHFLRDKQFSGAGGLELSDAMAVDIAAQACLLVLHWGPPAQALKWYGDFVGIIIYPGDVVARRSYTDRAGVVHSYKQVIMGEAMEGGPLVLSWQAVRDAARPTPGSDATAWGAPANAAPQSSHANVVIHEFAHKIDMHNGTADGCPLLPAGFMGATSAKQGYGLWHERWSQAYENFVDQLGLAERFGAPQPWLDAYAATAPAEFFAVACEAFFTHRARFGAEFPALAELLLAFFEPDRSKS